jgi:murein tripeptide amidase MpaA
MSSLAERYSEKYMKKLIGRTDIEDGLKRLDKLTQEEARMATAQVLKVAHTVDERVRGVADRVDDVDDRVARVDERVASVDERVMTVQDNVAVVINGMLIISSQPTEKFVYPHLPDGKDTRAVMQQVANDVDQVKRLSFSNHTHIYMCGLTIHAENQVRQDLRTWLSPPDPSTNHNVACNAHHEGTATWFFQGSIFEEWKSTSSLIWLYGKRTLFYCFSPGGISG